MASTAAGGKGRRRRRRGRPGEKRVNNWLAGWLAVRPIWQRSGGQSIASHGENPEQWWKRRRGTCSFNRISAEILRSLNPFGNVFKIDHSSEGPFGGGIFLGQCDLHWPASSRLRSSLCKSDRTFTIRTSVSQSELPPPTPALSISRAGDRKPKKPSVRPRIGRLSIDLGRIQIEAAGRHKILEKKNGRRPERSASDRSSSSLSSCTFEIRSDIV